ncbi:MAG: pyridoxal phosphate-dependent aminotransferase [Chitinispirillales bacterium]|jgi:cystathionine beta-lyase|nr:pyridoxal phosphate-dependent aminotransferase [Chitinispirillales bacterium]
MKYNFDRVVDRYGTYSVKYDPRTRGKPVDALPMWVADMDFPTPPCVQDALTERARHGIFGYSEPDAGYFSAVQGWFEKRFGWRVEQKWLSITPGVVNAIYIAVRAFTKRGAGVLIQQPVYYPFESAVKHTGRELLVNELTYRDGKYGIDFDDFEAKARCASLFILCNPHNPVGRVWTRDELMRMGEICLKYRVVVISDDIHQDFVYNGHRHLVFSELDKRFAGITVTCTAPSKTFNLAGLPHANIFIANDSMRREFRNGYASIGLSQPGVMGIVACKAAYEGGAQWLDELISYLSGNMSLIREFLPAHTPKIKFVEPEGTYLAWLDFSALGLAPRELDDAVTDKAKLWFNSGPTFGMGGAGFQRMNVGCPRSLLRVALERLKSIAA